MAAKRIFCAIHSSSANLLKFHPRTQDTHATLWKLWLLVNYVQVTIQCLRYWGDRCINSLDCLHCSGSYMDDMMWPTSTGIAVIEQGLTSYQTHYRSYRGRFLEVIWPNQQCQSTEGNDRYCSCSSNSSSLSEKIIKSQTKHTIAQGR